MSNAKKHLRSLLSKPLRLPIKKQRVAKESNFLERDYKNLLKKVREIARSVLFISEKVKDFEAIMKSVQYTNENADTTLCKVLHAIRQNQFLNAWYPEQSDKKVREAVKLRDEHK